MLKPSDVRERASAFEEVTGRPLADGDYAQSAAGTPADDGAPAADSVMYTWARKTPAVRKISGG
jgi:hypothetical protein